MSLPKPVPLNKKRDKKMIPEDTLMDWIDQNVDTSGVNIIKVRDHYMWTQGDIERHRLDVFEKYEVEGEGEFCWTNRISERSFFLHYDRSNDKITDKTTGRVEEENPKVGTLKGISNGSERIGKSFR
jgi:hypothetical protein